MNCWAKAGDFVDPKKVILKFWEVGKGDGTEEGNGHRYDIWLDGKSQIVGECDGCKMSWSLNCENANLEVDDNLDVQFVKPAFNSGVDIKKACTINGGQKPWVVRDKGHELVSAMGVELVSAMRIFEVTCVGS